MFTFRCKMFSTCISFLFSICLYIFCLVSELHGHGYLYDPPSRSSMWRHGFNVPTNYDDNALSCGGKQIQWGRNGGKCGICGDRFDGRRDNEAGGVYASGIISRTFTKGQIIPIAVEITAPHGGWYEFRLCPNNDVTKPATQSCLDRYLLRVAQNPMKTRVTEYRKGRYDLKFQLPVDLTCDQCVLQWKWNTGKDWGCDGNTCGVGYGPQEQFYGCADIAITESGEPTDPKITTKQTTNPTIKTTTPRQITPAPSNPTTTTAKPISSTRTSKSSKTTTPTTDRKTTKKSACLAIGIFRGTVMNRRCVYLCSMNSCPTMLCNEACQQLSSQ